MTEDEARGWIAERHGGDRVAMLDRLMSMIVAENERQNLIAPSTVESIWARHALDSAQLLRFDRPGELWLDIGTGGGFPGLVVAVLRDGPVVMIEPRKRRAEFLSTVVADLAMAHARVVARKIEQSTEPAGIISARAVASLDKLFGAARQSASAATRWILPKGRTAGAELEAVRQHWHGVFHVEHSIAADDAGIIIAERVTPR